MLIGTDSPLSLLAFLQIMQHFPGDSIYRTLPVVFVDSWKPNHIQRAITKERMEKWLQMLAPYFEDLKKRRGVVQQLSSDYWWAKVVRTLNSDGATALPSTRAEEPTVAIEWDLSKRKSDSRERRWDKLLAAEPWTTNVAVQAI